MDDNIILLDYKHLFMGSFHAVGHGPEHVMSRCYLHRIPEFN